MNMKSQLTTLCYLQTEDSYLLMHRIVKKNDINHNKWIGVGGHFEADESPEECLLREVKEETGLTLTKYDFRGIVTFVSDDDPAEYMCLYTAEEWTGDIKECDEGKLEWVDKKELLNLPIWEGDKIFLELINSPSSPFFSLRLEYIGDKLISAILNDKNII